MNKKGFTLIELLVVIAIIGLLSTLAVVSLNNARAKSRDAKRVSDIKQVQTALELFYNDNNGYPTATVTGSGGDVMPSPSTGNPAWSTYMGVNPQAPTPADGSCTGGATGNNRYVYAASSSATYTITFCLGGATGQLPAGVRTATPSGIQ